MKLLVTAGPTREYLDPVRFLSNGSSGRLGFAIAAAAVRRGHEVTLIAGPVELPSPPGCTRLDVVSALEMSEATASCFDRCDALIMTAAVCDYRPAERQEHKIKKQPGEWMLRLVRNPDILEEMGRRKGERILFGFALESQEGQAHALDKMHRKHLDAIALNAPANLGADEGRYEIFLADGSKHPLGPASKTALAEGMLDVLEQIAGK